MARSGGWLSRLQEAVEQRTGMRLEESSRVEELEEQVYDAQRQGRELDLLGWTVLDYFGGKPQELEPKERRNLAQKARVVWMQDPQAGAAVDLMNDFVFGRGVPKPKAHDDAVQEVIDEAWDDPDNQLILTSYLSQVALGTDLALQSNLFLLVFDDGGDGRVKLGLLDHDSVETVVRDPENRLRVLYYLAKEQRQDWDFTNDRVRPSLDQPKVLYYEHWRNVDDAAEQGKPPVPPKSKLADGRVYHIAINRTSEMVFGVSTMRRTLRWFSAYNDFMKARVDMAQAAAAFIMRRKVKGTPNQVVKMATKAISRQSDLAAGTYDDPDVQVPPRPGTIVTENENVSHESMNLNSNASNAAQDAQMLRSVISASTRFPQHYLGDAGTANLATATAMELPVLKAVEARQEVFEQMFRWFLDRVIERAVDTGRLDPYADEDEASADEFEGSTELSAAHEDRGADETRTERDLGYEFNMPSPLRRMMADLVGSIANIARTFDPNNTNTELSRVLLGVALGEGLEIENPADVVQQVFPEGYVDPAIAAAQEQAQQPPPDEGSPGEFGAADNGNPYSAPQQATAPEDVQGAQEARTDIPAGVQASARGRSAEVKQLWDEDVTSVVTDALAKLLTADNENGHTPLGTRKRGEPT